MSLTTPSVHLFSPIRYDDIADVQQSDTFSSMTTQMKGSAGRLTRMAASGNRVAILKLSGIVIGVFLVLFYGAKLIF